MTSIALLALLIAVGGGAVAQLGRAWTAVKATTLVAPWCWTVGAVCLGFGTSMLELFLPDSYEHMSAQAWYWVSIAIICPFIAVLGSRRPTNRVWNWFIMLPLICVLGWPVVTALARWPRLHPLDIQAPVVAGFGLTQVMGVGNYLSTRYALPALLAGSGSIFALVPLTTFRPAWWPPLEWHLPTWAVCGAIILASRQARRPVTARSAHDAVWFEFQDLFGLVWSVRIMERINATARQENWKARLEMDGFQWDETVMEQERLETTARIDHTLRWLLRRFVDPEWLDVRLSRTVFVSQSETDSVQSEMPPGRF